MNTRPRLSCSLISRAIIRVVLQREGCAVEIYNSASEVLNVLLWRRVQPPDVAFVNLDQAGSFALI